ncbi:cell surface A33 antigen-like [Heptranchias perlo]|uniref:cell surface A33 antigen-like n=1 Tax=Heptranchias perlo TaxID=212740 RepID=UPI0035594330
MWFRTCFALAWVSQVCTQATKNSETEKYIFGPLHNSILLSGNVRKIIDGQQLQWSFLDRSHKTLILYHPVGVRPAAFTSYYQHRSTYYVSNGSLELHRLEMADSGIYQLTIQGYYSEAPSKLFTYLVILDVKEILSTPLIVQDPTYVVNSVQLSCIVRNGRPRKLLWWKGNEQVNNSSFYTLGADNSTLSIKNVKETHCGFYTCTVMNEISQQNISHFLIVNGIQFLHKRILVTSVVALVSMAMSFAAIAFIIFFGLKKYKAPKYQMRLTIAFLCIEMKCYVCLLVASVLCVFDGGKDAPEHGTLARPCRHCDNG